MSKTARRPWHPADYDDALIGAVKALSTGTANDAQQKRALDWIIRTVCGTYDLSYRPDSDRDTVFAEGKRHVGMQIVKMMKLEGR